MVQEHQSRNVRSRAGQWLPGVVAWVLRAGRPMALWPGAVPPRVLRRLGLTRGRLSLADSRCRRCFQHGPRVVAVHGAGIADDDPGDGRTRSEEHTSELQSRRDLVCRLLLEKKKKKKST